MKKFFKTLFAIMITLSISYNSAFADIKCTAKSNFEIDLERIITEYSNLYPKYIDEITARVRNYEVQISFEDYYNENPQDALDTIYESLDYYISYKENNINSNIDNNSNTYNGNCAVEISHNGEVIDRNILLVGYTLGQKGTEFSKSGDDKYFSVIELESGSVLLSAREIDGVTQATLYTVSDNRIVQLERYFADLNDKPEKGSEIRSFNLSHRYITDSNSIIFDINGESVKTTVDFDELTLKCDEKYESLLYCG